MKYIACITVFAAVLINGFAWGQESPPPDTLTNTSPPPSQWQVEYSVYRGTVTASGIIGVDINATGDHEQLTAKLKSSAFTGVKVGVHGNRLGIESGLLRSENELEVQNEFGVPFPNHGEKLTMVTLDFLLYPLRQTALGGVFRPYVSLGIGGAFSSVDLDNIDDQDNFGRPLASYGLGSKFQLGGQDGPIQIEVLFKNEHMFRGRPIEDVDFRMVSVGVVYTQFLGLDFGQQTASGTPEAK